MVHRPTAGRVRFESALAFAPSDVAMSSTDMPKRFVNAASTVLGTCRAPEVVKPTTSTSTWRGSALVMASEGSARLGTMATSFGELGVIQ